MISKRLSDISSDKEHFDKAAPIYDEALKSSDFNETLKFSPTIPTRCHRGRNIIWFNSPFSSNVKTNVGKLYIYILYMDISTNLPKIAFSVNYRYLSSLQMVSCFLFLYIKVLYIYMYIYIPGKIQAKVVVGHQFWDS